MDDMQKKIDEMHKLAKRLYTILLVTIIVSVVLFVLPLIGLFFELPTFLNTYGSINALQ